MNRLKKLALFALLMAGAAGSLLAQSSVPDASTIVTTATNTFNTVGALIVTVVGFFVVVKIVKWVRR